MGGASLSHPFTICTGCAVPAVILRGRRERPMARFLLRRLLLIIPVLLGIIFVTFVLVRAIPGDPCTAMLGEKATKQGCASFMERFGLNDNVAVQFTRYIS